MSFIRRHSLHFIIASLAALLSLALPSASPAAEGREKIVLWPAGAPGEKGDVGEELEQPLRPGDDTIRVANVTAPTLEVFRPAKDKANGTAVVICPGGGYNILAYNKEGTEVAEWLNTLGVTGIVLKYRVPAPRASSAMPLRCKMPSEPSASFANERKSSASIRRRSAFSVSPPEDIWPRPRAITSASARTTSSMPPMNKAAGPTSPS